LGKWPDAPAGPELTDIPPTTRNDGRDYHAGAVTKKESPDHGDFLADKLAQK
jgi:hypothetical protein